GLERVDLTSFSAIPTGDSANTDALIRILKSASQPPAILVAVDGDKGGSDRLKRVRPLADTHGVRWLQLDKGLTVEDYLPKAGELYVQAAANYVGNLAETLKTGVSREQVSKVFAEAAEAAKLSADETTTGIGEWAMRTATSAAKLKSRPSRLG